MSPSTVVFRLCLLIAALAAVATLTGLLWSGGDAPATVTTVRGETTQLYGEGLYRYDSVFRGAGNRGTDAVVLVLAVPLLLASAASYRRGSLRGALLLSGALAWLLYLYATLAVGTAYNELFAVYVALFSASLYAFALLWRSIDVAAVSARLSAGLPRRSTAAVMLASGVVTLVVWAAPLIAAMAQGQPPELLGHSTTMVTEALDLAVIVPATFIAGALLLRGREALGYVLAFPLLVLLLALLPVIAAQTVSQFAAGVSFTVAEAIGPIGGFLVLGVAAASLIVKILRGVSDDLPDLPDTPSQPARVRA